MRAQELADQLIGTSAGVHALLRDVQRYADADHDARFGLIERQLLAVLADIDHLADVAEWEADQELFALTDNEEGS
jgi:hypothetical protein